jgi:hypothetical protein
MSLCVFATKHDDKRVASTEDVPEVLVPYSQALPTGITMNLSGQFVIDPKTKQLISAIAVK